MNHTSIVHFWFGDLDQDGMVPSSRIEGWFTKNPDCDAEIKNRFGETIEAAASGHLHGWLAEPQGRLALVLLLDQFQRNIFRGSPQAFRCDAMTRDWVLDALRNGQTQALPLLQRAIFFLPLEHSERLEDQQQSLACYQSLIDEAPEAHRSLFSYFHQYAQKHHDVIAEFGRFPHRNVALGRENTPEETAYLAQPDAGF